MSINVNIELKAKSSKEQQNKIKRFLQEHHAKYFGTDNQIDTYFKIKKGRLKLRKGNIENKLIYYERENKKDSKQSDVLLINLNKDKNIEKIARKTYEILIEVEKTREIYFIENVKFHIDKVKNLGTFIEIEAIDSDGSIGIEKLKKQCDSYKKLFNINENDLISISYSDLLLKQKN